jgi:ribosomal-protein-alanine N-acetyltransferase
MVGFIAGDIRPEDHMAWIVTIGVLPEYRRQGIALALLQACEARITQPTVRLNVRLSNAGAIRLYDLHGYERVSIWSGYYQDGEDALVMEKKL